LDWEGNDVSPPISAEGVESTVTFYPVDALRIETNFAYTDSKLDDDEPGLGGLACSKQKSSGRVGRGKISMRSNTQR
jgi:hypothetical protein